MNKLKEFEEKQQYGDLMPWEDNAQIINADFSDSDGGGSSLRVTAEQAETEQQRGDEELNESIYSGSFAKKKGVKNNAVSNMNVANMRSEFLASVTGKDPQGKTKASHEQVFKS